MSDSKKYNSIVFLTTLSVYLGLVLVGGASSPVLAQAALTRNFDIQEEIEYKDDLDKQPDEEDFYQINLSSAIVDFINDINNLKERGFYNFDNNRDFYAKREHFFSQNHSSKNAVLRSEIDSELDKNLDNFLSKLDTKNLLNLSDFLEENNDQKSKHISLEIYTFVSGIKLLITLEKSSAQKASLLASNLNLAFLLKANRENNSTKLIYENTKATFVNNQVFIVTRLPRASIDSLLAENSAN